MARLVDISGQRFGVLTALHPHGRDAYLDREIQKSQEQNGSNRDRPQEAPS